MNPNGLWAPFALAASIATALLALTTTTTLWDRDEPRFAQAAVEMLSSGQYLVPTFNGELRAQKPILVYWLMTLSLRAFGKTELAVRFWSPIAIAVAALATFLIGRRLWSARVGLVAMAVLALTPLTLVEGIAATTDAVLLAAFTLSLALATETLYRPPRARDAALLGLVFGAGLLTKGPVALILPLAIVALTAWIARREIPWRRQLAITVVAAAAIGSAIFAAWAVPASAATSGRIVTQGLARENLWRVLEPMEGHGTPLVLAPFYYPVIVAAGFAPWVLYLRAATRRTLARGAWTSRPGALMLAWIAIPLVAFTASATKLPHYVLPVWPALALMVAVALVEPASDGARAPANPRRLGTIVLIVVAALGFGIAPLVDRLKPVPFVAETIHLHDSTSGPVFAYAFDEPSLVFYTGRRVVPLVGEAALVTWTRQPGKAILVAPRQAMAGVERVHGPLGLTEIASRRGWNHVKGERLELVAFVRPHDR